MDSDSYSSYSSTVQDDDEAGAAGVVGAADSATDFRCECRSGFIRFPTDGHFRCTESFASQV
jgi:hypothetical protein